MRSFTEIYEGNFEISWNFYKKGIIMHELKTGLYADKVATFGCSEKGSITHSFCKLPLYTVQSAKRKKTCENM